MVKADGYGHGAVDVGRGGARGGRDRALRRDGRRGARAESGSSATRGSSSSGRPPRRGVARGARGAARARRRRRPAAAGGHPGPSEARHRHGPLGPLGAARPVQACRRADDPSRHRRLRRRVRRAADRAFPGGDRRLLAASPGTSRTAPRRCGCRRARFDAARCGIALYGLSPFGADPADDGLEPVLGWRSELAQVKLLEAGREHRLRPAVRRRAADLDRDRAGRLRGRLPARPDRHRGAGRRRPADGRRHDLDGLVRRRAPRPSCRWGRR